MSTVDEQALKQLGDLSMEEPKQSTEDEYFPSVEGVEDILAYFALDNNVIGFIFCILNIIQIQAFELVIKEYPLSSKGLEDAPKTLADLTEAVIGAVYIDCNFNLDFVWQVFKSLLEPIITPEKLTRNHVTVLKEFCDQNKLKLEYVDKCNEIIMQFDVYIDEQLMGTGTGTYGRKKDIAKNRAAKDAFNNYNLLKFMDDTQKENELAEQK
ncbi:hypothetical protein ACFE04_016457 [Oxalis oulophora]